MKTDVLLLLWQEVWLRQTDNFKAKAENIMLSESTSYSYTDIEGSRGVLKY